MIIRPVFQLLLLMFCTLGVYYPTIFAPFNSLDDQLLVNQLLNQHGFELSRHFSPGGTYDYFRPLLTLSFELDKYVGGLQETFMHFVNVLLHSINVLLVYLLALRFCKLDQQKAGWIPFTAAALFAVHPINSEAVNWIMGRTDILAGVFVFLSLIFLIRAFEKQSNLWLIGSALTFFLGALCKETALFMIPGACFLLLCHAEPHLRSWRGRWMTPAYYGIAILGYFSLRWNAFQVDRGVEFTNKVVSNVVETATQPALAAQSETATLFDLVTTLLKASGFYFTKLLQPLPLNFAIHRIESYYIVPGVILLLLLVWLAWRRKLVGWIMIVSASIAVSALFVVLTGLAWTPLAERYMYIPCGVLMVGLVSGSAMRLRKMAIERLGMLIVTLLIFLSGWVTANRNIVWQDNLTLYQDTVQKAPGFAPAVNELAVALRARNRHEEANQLLSSNQMPVSDNAMINKAVYYWEQGDYPAARDHLIQLLKVAPDNQKTRILEKLVDITTQYSNDIDNEALKQNGYRDILGWLERITAISTTGFNYYRIGRVHLVLGDKESAQTAFARAAELFPEDSLYKKPAEKLARDLAK